MYMPWAYPWKRRGRNYEEFLFNLDIEEWGYVKLMEWHRRNGNEYTESEFEWEARDVQSTIQFARDMRKYALECEQYQ